MPVLSTPRARVALATAAAGALAVAALALTTLRSSGEAAGPGVPREAGATVARDPERPDAARPMGTFAPDACTECHRGLHPELVRAHESGPHAKTATCAECHGTNHASIFSRDGEVSSATCGRCHAARYEEFRRSRHGTLLKGGAIADTLRAHATTVGGCQSANGCHDVQRQNADGSVGKCASCHPGHAFEKGHASDPAICARCHSGPDHPQWEAWSHDKHGVLWRQDPASGLAPSCATCHLPGGNHDDGLGLTASVVERDGQPKPTLVPTISKEKHAAARAAMVAVCARCHGARLTKQTLDAGDDARFDALMLCEEAARIVRDLDAEGLLVPKPSDRTENPVAGGALALGAKQIYDENSSRAERLFYDMFMFEFPNLWRAAYHTDPNLIRWTVRERLKSALIEIRSEAERLRSGVRVPPK